ncbi:MAG TPA: hypothetical protein VEA69_02945 [Tepidisphaeraceae bacterium]|nr:hypothetical protein [Tepidisphaeraceae bacterium]
MFESNDRFVQSVNGNDHGSPPATPKAPAKPKPGHSTPAVPGQSGPASGSK